MKENTYGFVGLGLLGGSIAKAIKKAIPDSYIMAYAPHYSTVDAAAKDGVVDRPLSAIGEDFRECEIVFLCAPVSINNDNLKTLLPYIGDETTITDIGSVKSGIHNVVKELGIEDRFIGGHPMAGTERIGYANSKAGLLENAYYILTKTDKTRENKLSEYEELIKKISAIPLIVPYQQHDYITAAISHVPHVVSASLVNLVKDSDSEDHLMKTVAAGGFKDITRISSSSPTMWNQICMANPDNISELLSKYIDSLYDIKLAIDEHDEEKVTAFFESAREYRESFVSTSSGPIRQVYDLWVDIDDRPGNLARVATILSDHMINIKNIGIIHNREYQNGALRIELHDQEGLSKSREVLHQAGYTCYNRF